MTERFSPTIRRQHLGGRLRRLRELVTEPGKLTAEQAAKKLGWSQSKISKIEAGHVTLSPTDLKAMCKLYGADKATVAELDEARKRAHELSWWQTFPGTEVSPGTYIDLEAGASRIRSWDPLVWPGLLQTPDVAREVIHSGLPSLSMQQVESVVELRVKRSEVLFNKDGDTQPPEVQVILGEAVLRTVVGSPAVMGAQLDRVLKLVGEAPIMLQVMPFSAGAHAGLESGFALLDFPLPDPALGYVEYGDGALFVGKPRDVSAMHTRYAHLTATAMRPDESLKYLRSIKAEYEKAVP